MGSFAVAEAIHPWLKPRAVLPSSSSLIPRVRVRSESVGAMRAMMGVVKYKGTQMRKKHLTEMIEKTVMEAKEVCKGDETSDECKVAWDQVEEVSRAKAHFLQKLEKQDPLEFFCQNNPELEECQLYED